MPVRTEHKYGRNPLVGGSWATISEIGVINWQTAAERIAVVSSDNVADTRGITTGRHLVAA